MLSARQATKSQAKQIVKPFKNIEVKNVFDVYPASVRRKLLALRKLIFRTAALTEGVGEVEETLKWSEPAYVTSQTRSGSTIRTGWKNTSPNRHALYFNCQTTLIETFRTLFPSDFTFEGNRAIIFAESDVIPTDALAFCIAAALTYHWREGGETQRKP